MRDGPKYCNQGVATLDARQRPVIATCALACVSVDHAELETITHRANQKCHMCSRKPCSNSVPGCMPDDIIYSGEEVKKQILNLRKIYMDADTGYIKNREIGRAEQACKEAGFRVTILHSSASPLTFAPNFDVSTMVRFNCEPYDFAKFLKNVSERERIMFITHLKPLQPKTAITDDLCHIFMCVLWCVAMVFFFNQR
jgi:hypothetical protein